MGEGKFSKSESNGRMGHCELGKEQDWQGQEKEKKNIEAWETCRQFSVARVQGSSDGRSRARS